jgi:hypothetical protein
MSVSWIPEVVMFAANKTLQDRDCLDTLWLHKDQAGRHRTFSLA